MKSNAEKGLSIIEVIIASSVFAIAAISVASFVVPLKTDDAIMNEVIAYKAASQVMESLMAMEYTTLSAQNGVAFQVSGLSGIPTPNTIGKITVTDVFGDTKLYKITVAVTYAGSYLVGAINVTLITMRSSA